MGIIQRQSIKASIATYIGVVIGAINLIILFPNFLLPEQFGLTRVLVSVAIILTQVSLLGAPFALIRFFPYFRNQEKKHFGFPALMMWIILIGFAISGIIVYIFRYQIENIYHEKSPLFSSHFSYIFPLAFLMALSDLFFYYCRALLKLPIPVFFKEVVIRVVQTLDIVLYIGKIVTFEQFLLIYTVSYVVQMLSLAGYVIYLKQFFFFSRVRLHHKVSLRQILRYNFLMFAAVGAAAYTQNIDIILLSYLVNLGNTGVYSIAYFIGTIMQVPARNMNMIAASVVAQAWMDNDHAKIQKLYSQTALSQLIIGGFIFLIVWVNTDLLLSFLPEYYQDAKWVIFVIGIGKLFDMASGINGEIINVSKHVKVNLLTNVLLIVIATISNFYLIQWYGIIGAAIATALSLIVYNVVRMGFLYAKYRLQPFNTDTLKAVFLFVVVLIIVLFLPSPENVWVSGIYKSTLVCLIFLIPLIVFRISPEINGMFKSLIASVRK